MPVVLPGWDSLDTARKIASVSEDCQVGLLILVVIFELAALLRKASEKLFGLLALAALLLLAGADYIGNQYNHRKEELYEVNVHDLNQKLHEDTESIRLAQARATVAENQVIQIEKESLPRTLTERQRILLIATLKPASPQQLYFASSPDPETQQFLADVSRTLAAADWKLVNHPYNWGTEETYPPGLRILVGDLNNIPTGALVLQSALMRIGYDAPTTKFLMVPRGKFALYVGPKPVKGLRTAKRHR